MSATAHLGHRAAVWGHRLQAGKPVLRSAPTVRTLAFVSSGLTFFFFLTSILSRWKIKKKANNFFRYSRSLIYAREVLDKACWSCRAEGQPHSVPTPGAGSTHAEHVLSRTVLLLHNREYFVQLCKVHSPKSQPTTFPATAFE